MATWEEVQVYFRENWRLDADGHDEFALTVNFAEGKRLQRVMVHRSRVWGIDVIEVRSAFGEIEDFDLSTLLTDSLALPVGGIAQHGRFLVVIAKFGLPHITVEGVEFMVTKIGMQADVLEERSRGEDRF